MSPRTLSHLVVVVFPHAHRPSVSAEGQFTFDADEYLFPHSAAEVADIVRAADASGRRVKVCSVLVGTPIADNTGDTRERPIERTSRSSEWAYCPIERLCRMMRGNHREWSCDSAARKRVRALD